jgi:hypothetical protein
MVTMKRLLPDTHELRNIQVRRMPDDALTLFEPQLVSAVRAEAYNPATVASGEFRQVVDVDGNGMRTHLFVGPEHFTKQMTRPGRRVLSFNCPGGPMKCVAGGTCFVR